MDSSKVLAFSGILERCFERLLHQGALAHAMSPERLMRSPHTPSHSLYGYMQACALRSKHSFHAVNEGNEDRSDEITVCWNLGGIANAGLSSMELTCQTTKSGHTEFCMFEDAQCFTH